MAAIKYPTENEESAAYCEWANLIIGVGDHLLHIPNEGKRSLYHGRMLKSIGLKKGVPDYFLAIPRGRFHGLWLEMKKRGTERHKIRDTQLEWQKRLRTSGYAVEFVYGWEHAVEVTKKYLSGTLC